MANIGSSTSSTSGIATTPTITNLVLDATPGTEESHVFVANLKQVMIKARQSNHELQFSFTTGETDTKFVTIEAGTNYFEQNLNLSSTTLFIESNKASTIVEILEWS